MARSYRPTDIMAKKWQLTGAIKWTRLSCRTFAANAVRLQLHALAYNLDNFLRTLATPEPIKDWSLTRTWTLPSGAILSHCRAPLGTAQLAPSEVGPDPVTRHKLGKRS